MRTQKEKDACISQAVCNASQAQGSLSYAMQDALEATLEDYPDMIKELKGYITSYEISMGLLEDAWEGKEI